MGFLGAVRIGGSCSGRLRGESTFRESLQLVIVPPSAVSAGVVTSVGDSWDGVEAGGDAELKESVSMWERTKEEDDDEAQKTSAAFPSVGKSDSAPECVISG